MISETSAGMEVATGTVASCPFGASANVFNSFAAKDGAGIFSRPSTEVQP